MTVNVTRLSIRSIRGGQSIPLSAPASLSTIQSRFESAPVSSITMPERGLTVRRSLRIVASKKPNTKSKYFAPGRIKLPSVLQEDLADLDVDQGREGELDLGGPSQTTRRRSAPEVSESSNPSRKKRSSRPYAPPEAYAHLTYLPDYLEDNLDGKPARDSLDLISSLLLQLFSAA